MRTQLLKTVLTSPLSVLSFSILISVLGIMGLVAFTKTLFLPTIFVALMIPVFLSAISGLSNHDDSDHSVV